MKKRLVNLIAAIVIIFCGLFALSSCDNKTEAGGGNEEVRQGLEYKTLNVDGTNVYGKVSNATETFSFLEEITANGASKFIVALDIYGAKQVASKTIPLSVGDNIAYIMETIDGETVKMYTVTVRRRPIYTVSFNSNGGTEVQPQQVEEDSFATEPAALEKGLLGYTFEKWNYDFSQAISQDTEVSAQWKASEGMENFLFQSTFETCEITGVRDTTIKEIFIPDYVTSIVYAELYGCDELESIDVDKGNVKYQSAGNCLIEIELKCLILGCKNSVIPADGTVTTIGDYAFYNCRGLTSITIPNSITFFGTCAFQGCSGLESISVAADNTKYHSAGNCLIETATKTLIIGCKKSIIPTDGTVTTIGDYAFCDCNGLTNITIPKIINTISISAFKGCKGLESIEVENGNTIYRSEGNCLIKIKSKTLILGCKNSVIPSDGTVTKIGSYAFYNCDGLTGITIPNSVTIIAFYAFGGCGGLVGLTYKGTRNEWNAVEKFTGWNKGCPSGLRIYCDDGVLSV